MAQSQLNYNTPVFLRNGPKNLSNEVRKSSMGTHILLELYYTLFTITSQPLTQVFIFNAIQYLNEQEPHSQECSAHGKYCY